MALFTARVAETRVATPRSRVVWLALDGRRFQFCAGQSIALGLHGQALNKPYSIACSPEQCQALGTIELLIQVGADGYAGAHLGAPAKGMLLDVDGPFGSFCFDLAVDQASGEPRGARLPHVPSQGDFLFIAGGTGIAPLRSMLWHALDTFPQSQPALFYSARAVDEFAYAAELRELARTGRLLLRETVTRDVEAGWTGERGRITRAHVAATVTPRSLCFVCGPPGLVDDVTSWLREIGVAPERIRFEGWV